MIENEWIMLQCGQTDWYFFCSFHCQKIVAFSVQLGWPFFFLGGKGCQYAAEEAKIRVKQSTFCPEGEAEKE
jgi:hypothetical protein